MNPVNATSDNAMYAVMQALAAASDAGATSQSVASGDLSSSEFMKQMYQMLNRYNGNMKAIEAFLKSYIAYHVDDTQKACLTGGALGLQNATELLTKLENYGKQLDAVQKKIDGSLAKLEDLGNSDSVKDALRTLGIDNLADAKNIDAGTIALATAKLVGQYMLGVGLLFPPAAIALAAAKIGSAVSTLKDMASKAGVIAAEMNDANLLKAGIEKEQTALVTGTSGSLNERSSVLSGQAHASLDNALQIIRLGFLFLSKLEKE